MRGRDIPEGFVNEKDTEKLNRMIRDDRSRSNAEDGQDRMAKTIEVFKRMSLKTSHTVEKGYCSVYIFVSSSVGLASDDSSLSICKTNTNVRVVVKLCQVYIHVSIEKRRKKRRRILFFSPSHITRTPFSDKSIMFVSGRETENASRS